MRHIEPMRALLLATAGLTLFAGGCTATQRIASAPTSPSITQAKPPASASASTSASPTVAMRTINSHPDYKFVLNDIPSLMKNSTLVVRGRIVAMSYFDWHTMTNTRVTLRVQSSNDPKVSVGSTVTVIEPGGITTEANLIRYGDNKYNVKITPEMERQPVEMIFDSAPLAKVGDEALYFLNDSEQMDGVPGHHYNVIGAVQGKFNIKNGVAERNTQGGSGGGMKSLRMQVSSLEKQAIARP